MKKTFLVLFPLLALNGLVANAFGQPTAPAPAPSPSAASAAALDATGWTTPRPPYPVEAKKTRMEGAVRVRIFTDRHGNVVKAVVVKSSGHKELDDNTTKFALGNWHGPKRSRADYVENYGLH